MEGASGKGSILLLESYKLSSTSSANGLKTLELINQKVEVDQSVYGKEIHTTYKIYSTDE